MFANADEVLSFIRKNDVQFVDVRFCDLPGVMQHFTFPVENFTESAFTDGLMFDGSSIRGFQQIHESDMMLLPDLTTYAYRSLFMVLFTVSAANVFVLAATSTMYGALFPLFKFAYPDFWNGQVSFNPLLAQLGVRGVVPALTLGAIYALTLWWLFRSILTNVGRVPERVPSW